MAMDVSQVKSLRERRKRIFGLLRKELDTLRKDKVSLLILFFVPVFCIAVIGTGQEPFSNVAATVWIVDYDHSNRSVQFVQLFAGVEGANVHSNYNESWVTIEACEGNITTNTLDAYIILYAGFEQDLLTNGTTSLPIYINSIDFYKKVSATAIILQGIVAYQIENGVYERDLFYFPEFKPEKGLTILQAAAPLMIGILLFATINLTASQAIVGDIPLKRILTTPTFRGEVIMAKIVAYAIMAILQILVLLVIMEFGFGLIPHSTFFDLFILLLLTSLSGITLGILFSAVSKTRLQASYMFLFSFIIFVVLVFMIRTEAMLQVIPLEHARIGYSNLAERGQTLLDIWPQLLGLGLFNVVIFGITLLYFQYGKKEFV
jgi:ABC-type multidrug transport system permease subunit